MAFTTKNWEDLPSTTTPLSAAALEDLEARLGAYADSVAVAGTDPNAVQETLIDTKADLLAGTANDTIARLSIPSLYPDGASLISDPATSTGLNWSVKSADYNIIQAGASPGFTGATVAAANTTAINAAFAAAAAAQRPCLIPPAGAFYHEEPLLMPSNLHVRGFGKGRSILRVDASVGLIAGGGSEIMRNLDYNAGNDNITLENFEIDGNRDARGGEPWQPDPYGVGHLQFRATNSGAFCNNIKLLFMHMHHAVGVGGGIDSVDGLLILGCEIHDQGRDGCSVLGGPSKNIRYIGNKVYGCGDDCFAITQQEPASNGIPHQNIVIAGNIVGEHPTSPPGNPQYGGHGFCLAGVLNAQVVGNTINEAAIGGIQISDGYPGGGPSPATPTSRIIVADNNINLPGQQYDGTAAHGWGIEVSQKYGSTITQLTLANNTINAPMSHCIALQRQGTGSISWVKIIGNEMIGGQGSAYHAAGAGIAVEGAAAHFVEVSNNTIRDMRGKAILGNNYACQNWTISNNRIYSCEMSTAGAGGPAIDITNFVGPRLSDNEVEDFAVPQNQSHAVGWSGATGVRMFNNDFTNCGRTATVSGTVGTGMLQANNVDEPGVLRAGNATAGNVV